MTEKLIKFINKYKEDINDLAFEKLYMLMENNMNEIHTVSEFTETFLNIGINPLEYMSFVPSFYLDDINFREIVKVPKNIQKIDNMGFAFSGITEVELHKDCELSPASFYRAYNLKSITIPYIMNEVPEECFYGCSSLAEVDLNSVEQIATNAFLECTSLKRIYIPDDINYISETAFYGCKDLVFHIHKGNEYVEEYAKKNKFGVKFV